MRKHRVLVPSVNRPRALERCLAALELQRRYAEFDVAVIALPGDEDTRSVAQHAEVAILDADDRGVAGAIEIGIKASVEWEIVSLIDDDAAPVEFWARRLQRRFDTNPKVGCVSGRDNTQGDSEAGSPHVRVGGVSAFGKVFGNHEVGKGEPRQILHAKGANMSFRTRAVANVPLGSLVQGQGAQYRNELVLCLAIQRQGWIVLYDPAIQVDHFHAPRLRGDERENFNADRVRMNQRNHVFGFASYASAGLALKVILHEALRGNRKHPGLATLAFLLVSEPRKLESLRAAEAALTGILQGTKQGLKERKRQSLHD